MHIKRRPLIFLLVLAQVGCMTFGVVWATRWLRAKFEKSINESVVAQGEATALEIARQAVQLPADSVEPGTPGWDELQRACRDAKVPRNGFVAVMRSDTGALACHTRLEEEPELLGSFPGRLLLVTDGVVQSVLDAIAMRHGTGRQIVAGEVEIDGQLYALTGVPLPNLKGVVLVYQSSAFVDKELATLVNPLVQVGFILIASVALATTLLTTLIVRRFESTVTRINASLEREVENRTQSLTKTRNAVVFGLAKLAESRDKDTGSHLERIRSYVTILASEMAKTNPEISHHYVANLSVASSLHDIGKVGVPDAVLLKPGKLTPSERSAMQMHSALGGECLAAIQRQLGDDDFLELARQVAMAHHEQWDGSGYPLGLRGREIPLAARIVALADVYDALTTDRPYRAAMSHVEAREWIVAHYGTHFDPEVVEAFVVRERDFAKLADSESTTGEGRQAAVTGQAAPLESPLLEPVGA